MKHLYRYAAALMVAIMLPLTSSAAIVSPATALQVAEHQLNAKSSNVGATHKAPRKVVCATTEPAQPFYIFNAANGKGYVIVAGDDCAHPVLAYSNDGHIDVDAMPTNLHAWLNGYAEQIRWAQNQGLTPDAATQQEWQSYLGGENDSAEPVVGPLLKTAWNQYPYYNNLCPVDTFPRYGNHVTAGCVAVAMAQVMRYHNWPVKGTGSHSYTPPYSQYGVQSANFGETTYDWANMPYQLGEDSTDAQKNAVATLIYHCGVAVDMEYNVDSLGSSSAFLTSAVSAFVNYFGYDNAANEATLPMMWYLDDYILISSKERMVMILLKQLDKQLPVPVSATNSESKNGHAFVCDGYDTNHNFHFDFGWGGIANGYFSLYALTPYPGFDFSYNTQFALNIQKPREGSFYDLQMALPEMVYRPSEMDTSNFLSGLTREAKTGETLALYTNIINGGNIDYVGDLYAYLYRFVDSTQVVLADSVLVGKGITIAPRDEFSDVTPYTIPATMEAGNYVIAIKTGDTAAHIGVDYVGVNGTLLTISEREEEDLSDKFIILAKRKTGNYFYMTADLGTATTKRFQAVDAGTDVVTEINTTPTDPAYVWGLETDASGGVMLKNGSSYAVWESGNSADLSTNSALILTCTLIDDDHATLSFVDSENNTRYLALNNNSKYNYFAFYKEGNQIQELLILSYGATPSAVETISMDTLPTAQKIIRDGQVYIIRGDKVYTTMGVELK